MSSTPATGPSWITATLLMVAVVLTAVFVSVPSKFLPYTFSACVLAALAVAALFRPIWLLYFLILSSALSGVLRSFDRIEAGSTDISVSGLRWALLALLLSFIILRNIQRIVLPKYFVPYFVFVAWVVVRWLIGSRDLLGLKDVLFYSLPLVAGLFALIVLQRGSRSRARVENVLLQSVWIPVGLYLVLIPVGLIELTEFGPLGALGPRPVATYLLVVLSVSLALWTYGEFERDRRRGQLVSLLAVGLIIFTLSRMAIATALVLISVARIKPFSIKRIVASGLVTVTLAGLLVAIMPALRTRFFYRPPTSPAEAVELLNLSGRDKMWSITLDDALEKPFIGWGLGTARPLVAVIFDDREDVAEYSVHNEYLALFHDLGAIGLGLFLWAWIPLLVRHWSAWKKYDTSSNLGMAKHYMAATLSILLVTANALVDNTLHYSHIMVPVFIVLASVRASSCDTSNSLSTHPKISFSEVRTTTPVGG
jgi:hypothetical protein